MVSKKDFNKAVKEMEKQSPTKPKDSKKSPSLESRLKRIVEGDDSGYHLR
jgi:hypothetical protein